MKSLPNCSLSTDTARSVNGSFARAYSTQLYPSTSDKATLQFTRVKRGVLSTFSSFISCMIETTISRYCGRFYQSTEKSKKTTPRRKTRTMTRERTVHFVLGCDRIRSHPNCQHCAGLVSVPRRPCYSKVVSTDQSSAVLQHHTTT